MKAKGWRTYQDAANELGFTRQYVCMLDKARVAATHIVISRLATALGITNGRWWIHFEIVPHGVTDPNLPDKKA